MAIILTNPDWKLPDIRIPKGGGSSYNDVQCLNEHLYDVQTGEPINDEVKEMDACVDKKTWDPVRFDELWNKLNESGYFVSDMYN